jgi:multisubunit Na+/H+ antiporter MnhB subunit
VNNIINFIGSLLIIAVAVGIFMMLMEKEMPQENRELLIAFVSVLFGAMASSIKKITGDDK